MSQTMRALRYALTIDAAQLYMQMNPHFSTSFGNTWLPITVQGYGLCCLSIIVWVGRLYCVFQLQYRLLSVLCVAVGLYKAKDFPPILGRWRDAYTVRRFWGSVIY